MRRVTDVQFGSHLPVYMTKPDRSYILRTIGELVPLAFEPESLWEPRINDENPMQNNNNVNNGVRHADIIQSSNCNSGLPSNGGFSCDEIPLKRTRRGKYHAV